MISTKGRYALRVMIDIGRHQNAAPVSVKDISSRQDISVKYLEQVVSILSKAGLIRSFRGNAGGYKLNVDPEKCTAGDILRVCEGSLSPVACLQDEKSYCERSAYCETLLARLLRCYQQICRQRHYSGFNRQGSRRKRLLLHLIKINSKQPIYGIADSTLPVAQKYLL